MGSRDGTQYLNVPPRLAGAHQSSSEDEAALPASAPLLSYKTIVAARQQAGAPRRCPRRVRRCYRVLSGACPGRLTRYTLLIAVYILTGAAQPTLTDALRYSGGTGAERSVPLLLPMLASTAGMASVGLMSGCPLSWPTFLVSEAEPTCTSLVHRVQRSRQMALLLVVDMASSALIVYGLLLVGSGVYVVMCANNRVSHCSAAS